MGDVSVLFRCIAARIVAEREPMLVAIANELRAAALEHFAQSSPVHIAADAVSGAGIGADSTDGATAIVLLNQIRSAETAHAANLAAHAAADAVNFANLPAAATDAITAGALAYALMWAHNGHAATAGTVHVEADLMSYSAGGAVRFGDFHVSEHYAGPRVVLTMGDGDFTGARDIGTNPKSIYEWRPGCEAHLYTAETQDSLRRLLDLQQLIETVARAVHATGEVSRYGAGPDVTRTETGRDAQIFRNGESAILYFMIGMPVTRGPLAFSVPDLTVADTTSDPATGGSGLVINPST